VTGGTIFVIGSGVTASAVVVAAVKKGWVNERRRRRLGIYAVLVGLTFVFGFAIALLVLLVNPNGPMAPAANGWTLGHIKWIPIGLAAGVGVGLTVAETLVSALGNHIGHPYEGCERHGCKGTNSRVRGIS